MLHRMADDHQPSGSYAYDQAWADERARLAALSSIYDPGTFRLLEQLGVAAGWSCLEVGAGEGSVTRWLGERVGASGRVLAVDLDPRFISAGGVVEVRQHDILTGAPEAGAFDLVHARAVVEWVTDRPAAIANMIAALKPGGILLVEDVDVEAGALSYPPSEARQAAARAFEQLARAGGADLTFGRELRLRIQEAGLAQVGNDVRTLLIAGGEPQMDFLRLSMRQLGPLMVANNLLTEQQLTAVDAEMSDPNYFGYPPLMVAVWGRRPT
jgi:SAM-dependent methyltransferase